MRLTTKFGGPSYNPSKVIECTSLLFWQFLDVFGPNDLECQGRISPYAIPSENLPRYTYKQNVLILGAFFQKLLSVQAKVDKQMDGQTDACDDNAPRS